MCVAIVTFDVGVDSTGILKREGGEKAWGAFARPCVTVLSEKHEGTVHKVYSACKVIAYEAIHGTAYRALRRRLLVKTRHPMGCRVSFFEVCYLSIFDII